MATQISKKRKVGMAAFVAVKASFVFQAQGADFSLVFTSLKELK
jgi:hypothetical protein